MLLDDYESINIKSLTI